MAKRPPGETVGMALGISPKDSRAQRTVDRAGAWGPSPALYRLGSVVLVAVSLGLINDRIDLVALAVPFVVLAAWALTAPRPTGQAAAPIAASSADGDFTGGLAFSIYTEITNLEGVQWVSVVQPSRDGRPTAETLSIAGGDSRTLQATVTTQDWGHHVMARPDVIAYCADGLLSTNPRRGSELTELLLPATEPINNLEFAPLSGGWAGAHTSRRPGQGSDLVDLRQFQPGDRLRSIHWRAYARHQKLYTRRTLSEADADIMLCLDLRSDVGPTYPPLPFSYLERLRATLERGWHHLDNWIKERQGGPDAVDRAIALALRMRTSLDLTIYAATAIAASQLGAGDRVGVLDVSSTRSRLRPGTGQRHLHRVRYHLAQQSTGSRRPPLPVQWWALPPNAIVMFFSPLLDQAAADMVLTAQAHGHQVLVVDVLPLRGMAVNADKALLNQLRILAAEREIRLQRIRGSGVPVLAYEDAQLSAELAAASRALRRRR